ncbi:MAG TPA: glycosyltransferase family 2 protein [Pyrinomonadaceae bacterium]|nr:glycosyltransferase family 2 protein [Pyrinomonadaceae bacterium]
MWVFYFFAAIVIWLGVLSLRGGFRFSAYVQRQLSQPLSDYHPFASVIVPCRGAEPDLADNLKALFQQTYPAYEIVFVTDSESDPSVAVIQSLIDRASKQIPARLLIAGAATDSGQKVHNLRQAVAQVDPRCEVLVFVDSDARPRKSWLLSLVAPLADEELGAASGYRWFVPLAGGFASRLRSVWNASIASALGADRKSNFCWGGSTAMRRETFARLKIAERWPGSVSDDFTITRVLGEAKLPIHFVPACLVASPGDCDFRELLEFSNRQLKITRVYAPHLWKSVLLGSALFCLVFFGGILLVLCRAIAGLSFQIPLTLIVVIFVLGAAKAFVRFSAVSMVLGPETPNLQRDLPAHLLLWPLGSLLYFYNALTAAVSRRINWRGIEYELKSPDEVVIIGSRQ